MARNEKNYTRFRLSTAGEVQRFLGKIISELYAEKIPESRAKALGYLCGISLKAIECGELEERLQALEEMINDKQETA